MRRWPADASVNAGGWGWDAISHYGGAIGNLDTKANAARRCVRPVRTPRRRVAAAPAAGRGTCSSPPTRRG
ncbi:hypothetical protein G6F54_014425 [Rhizopus delemar]|nr:hypothetical protein G6F54_014425 [Rhizopus delemar]